MQIVDWEHIWEEKTKNRTEEMMAGQKNDTDYWSKRAQSYSDTQTTNDFIYGRSVVEALEGVLTPDFEVMDVGVGPGTLTLPFTEKVKRVIAVEPAPEMVSILKENAETKNIDGYDILQRKWQDVDVSRHARKYDLVISSHVLWHFVDIWNQITRMESVSRRYCCLVNGLRDYCDFDLLWEKVIGKKKTKLYGTEGHLICLNLLHEKGRKVNVKIIEYKQKIPVESWIASREMVLGRYIEVDEEIKKVIRAHIIERSDGNYYEMDNAGAVMWWKVPEGINT